MTRLNLWPLTAAFLAGFSIAALFRAPNLFNIMIVAGCALLFILSWMRYVFTRILGVVLVILVWIGTLVQLALYPVDWIVLTVSFLALIHLGMLLIWTTGCVPFIKLSTVNGISMSNLEVVRDRAEYEYNQIARTRGPAQQEARIRFEALRAVQNYIAASDLPLPFKAAAALTLT